MKLLLTSTPVLVHPNFDLPFHIHCDASGKGVGAVLSQYVDGAYRPIAFCSKKLLPHQVHWSPAQLEAYAIFHSVTEKWRYYLALSKTIIHSDHRNLIWLFNHSHKGMIGRWYAALTAFDLDISYVSGSSQMVADPLSRLFEEADSGQYDEKYNPFPSGKPRMAVKQVQEMAAVRGAAAMLSVMGHVGAAGTPLCHTTITGRRSSIYTCGSWLHTFPAMVPAVCADGSAVRKVAKVLNQQMGASTAARSLPLSVWASHQRADDRLGPIYEFLMADATVSLKKFSARVCARAQSFRIVNGVLHYRPIREVGVYDLDEGWVVAVPVSLREKVIEECHGDNVCGHGGVAKTVMAIRQRYYFRHVHDAVRAYIKTCKECKRAKARCQELSTALVPMVSSQPFRAISIDLFSPGVVTAEGFRYVLTVVDLCTKWVMFIPVKTKFPAEIMTVLCTTWFHTHGIPEFILSDRGKEFLGVASTVCQLLGIKHVKTTPYHPRTNGLCESQHKMLASELKIRLTRPSTPSWSDLLTEIAFSNNVTPSSTSASLSPFNLVFGRKPRLSPQDICFPTTKKPWPLPSDATKARYLKRLQNKLHGLRFRALDDAYEAKEDMRERHDTKRSGALKVVSDRAFSVGDVVSVCQPTPKLKKIMFQWSEPVYVVVSVTPSTCEVRSLARKKGATVTEVSKAGSLPSVIVNKKMASSFPVPVSFFIGAKVMKKFGTHGWHEGTVDRVETDEGETLWHVVYGDFDEEEYKRDELAQHLAYHPMLDNEFDLDVPEVGSFVWFAHKHQPCLGQVLSVDPTVSRPLMVKIFSPQASAVSLARAKYKAVFDDEGEPQVQQITVHQVRIRFKELSKRGFLPAKVRGQLRRCLSS